MRWHLAVAARLAAGACYAPVMPGRLFLTTPIAEVAHHVGATAPDVADLGPRRNIAPGQEICVLTPDGLSYMRWGMIPVGRVNARGRPVMETIVNVRGETVFDKTAFRETGRAVVPADGWYEWTGQARRKTAWRIVRTDRQLCLFAAITDVWTAPGGRQVPQVALVTCPPGPDVAPIHDRMAAILAPEDVETWLTGAQPKAQALIRPLGGGMLAVQQADDVDWTAP